MSRSQSEGLRLSAAGPAFQVLCWWSVCVFYVVLCVSVLPEFADSAKARCGVELIADLEFVCGDRGFYRGRVGGGRNGGPRSRGKGIVEQCCIKGCDLQYLETYCAKPKRGRRQASLSPHQTREDQFWQVFLTQYQRQAKHNADQERPTRRIKERRALRNASSAHFREKILKSAHSKPRGPHKRRTGSLRTLTPHGHGSFQSPTMTW